jgi:lipid-binding SYLF domain-containing protein
METYLESADIARVEGITTAAVRLAVAAGKITVAAVTARGTRLFRRADVEAYSKERRERLVGRGGRVVRRVY